MPSKPIDIPPEAARAFVRDMKAFFAAGHDKIKADAIAAQQMAALQKFQGPREKPLRIGDIKAMFLQMRDEQ